MMSEYPQLGFYEIIQLPADFISEALIRRGARIKYEGIRDSANALSGGR